MDRKEQGTCWLLALGHMPCPSVAWLLMGQLLMQAQKHEVLLLD